MSLFGPIDDDDHRRGQHRNLLAVTELVQHGVKRKLPPVTWNIPTIGTVTGTVDVFGSLADAHPPREVFEAWFKALSKHPRVSPGQLGITRDGGQRHERTDQHGQTRMIAAFNITLNGHPRCEFCLLAEWFTDEDAVEAAGAVSS